MLQPVAGHIVVEPQKKDKVTESGIVLAPTHEDKPQQGTVISVGNSVFREGHEVTAPCQVNDIVVYKEWGGKEYKDGDSDLLILKFEDIMAIVK